MKTSNRILLIFFINIFLIPLCLFIGFSAQIRGGKYTREENRIYQDVVKTGTLKPAHTVKLMASERLLVCNVEYGDSLYYRYDTPYSEDSLSIVVSGDTLFVNYVGTIPDDILRQGQQPLNVKLFLPQVSSFIVENGLVNVLSMDTTKTQTVLAEVTGGGVFNIGGPAIVSGENRSNEKHQKRQLLIDQLSFTSHNGRLELADSVKLRSLKLQVTGNSTIQLNKGVEVKEVSGSISDSTKIEGNWDVIKKINH